MYKELDEIIERLNKIGIHVQLLVNCPWVYVDKINNKKVKENFNSEHGWVLGIYHKSKFQIESVQYFINLIRKYK